MESLVDDIIMNNINLNTYKGKNVLVTGSSGFKGSWMCLWLHQLGANVTGYSLEPPTEPSLFHDLKIASKINQATADIRDFESLKTCIQECAPDVIFHMAAQPLVRESYAIPVETIDVNVMGTVYLLEAVKETNISTNIVCITSDKSYENQEWLFGYRENDAMGGYDPYSASKGAAEILISSYRQSFFNVNTYDKHKVKLASVRAGNVIGGGDWAKDRIVPDCVRSLQDDKSIFVRNPYATRPWQHVLEPVGGYLLLGAKMYHAETELDLKNYCSAFNFGPVIASNKNVKSLVESVLKYWESGSWHHENIEAVHEASLLNLTIDKAFHLLKWLPIWDYENTIKETIGWYKQNFDQPSEIESFTYNQINRYNALFHKNLNIGAL